MNQIPIFLKGLHHKQLQRIGFYGDVPDESTFRRVLGMLDFVQLDTLLSPWFASEGLEGRAIALDGKRLNGAHNSGEKPPQVLNVTSHANGEVLGQAHIGEHRDEREASKRFIASQSLMGSLVTADALHTNSEFIQIILDAGADYFLYVKKNQPIAYEYIESLKLPELRGAAHGSTCEMNRGRKEIREIWTTTRFCKQKTETPLLPGAGQVGTIVRTVTNLKTGKTSRQCVHFVTSLMRTEAMPGTLLKYARSQWSVESKNHYVKDTTMGEDKSRCRRKSLPQILATLRNVALKILREVQLKYCTKKGRDTIPEAIRYLEKSGGVCSILSR